MEQRAFALSTNAQGQGNALVVPDAAIQGMRKVKHITISASNTTVDAPSSFLYWAVVYVPAGTTVNPLTVGQATAVTTMYEPNQFVMSCGVFDWQGGPLRVRVPISRNLNSGDTIQFVCQNSGAVETYHFVVQYAICLLYTSPSPRDS